MSRRCVWFSVLCSEPQHSFRYIFAQAIRTLFCLFQVTGNNNFKIWFPISLHLAFCIYSYCYPDYLDLRSTTLGHQPLSRPPVNKAEIAVSRVKNLISNTRSWICFGYCINKFISHNLDKQLPCCRRQSLQASNSRSHWYHLFVQLWIRFSSFCSSGTFSVILTD